MKPIKVDYWFNYIRQHPTFTGCLINKDNNIYWFKNGKNHREDGPAMEYVNGSKWWWLNNEEYSEQEWLIAARKFKLEKVLKNING